MLVRRFQKHGELDVITVVMGCLGRPWIGDLGRHLPPSDRTKKAVALGNPPVPPRAVRGSAENGSLC